MTFARIKALGWAMFEVLTSAQMTQLDIDHAKATDSTYVKDYAAACFLPTKIVAGTWPNSAALVFTPTQGFWVGVSTSAASRSCGGYVIHPSTTFPAGWTAQPQANAIAHDGNSVIMCGSIEGAGVATIYRRSTDFGLTWAKQSTATSLAPVAFVAAMNWFAAKSLFVSGFASGAIETSPDGITWTNRAAPDALRRNAIASNGVIAVMVSGQSGGTGSGFATTSTDGITWTNRALPSVQAWMGVDYSPIDGVFIAIADNGTVAKSSDGITWTSVAATYATTVGALFQSVVNLRCINNMWLAPNGGATGALLVSIDQGATWKILMEMTAFPNQGFGVAIGQIAISDGSVYLSNKLSLN